MLLPLDELVLKCFEEKAVKADHIFHLLLFLIHHGEPLQPLVSEVVAGNFHGNLLVGQFHLRHIDNLTEEVLVHGKNPRSLITRADLQLLVIEEVHLVDECSAI